MGSALRVRYTLDDSMKAMAVRYPGCPPFAEGKHPSLRCRGRAAASRHTQLLSGFPCCLGETLLRETSAEKRERSRNYISCQSAGSAERSSWCLARAVTWRPWVRSSPDSAEGKLLGGVVVCLLWHYLTRKAAGEGCFEQRNLLLHCCAVPLGCSFLPKKLFPLFLPVLCSCNFSCYLFRCLKSWLLAGTKSPSWNIPSWKHLRNSVRLHIPSLRTNARPWSNNLSALTSHRKAGVEELRIKYGFKYFLSFKQHVLNEEKQIYLFSVKQSTAGSGLQ